MSNLEIRRVNLQESSVARGVVIVIDVIRAFSVAAYAFSGGAQRLWLVRSVDDAFALHKRKPDALLAGEVGGSLIPGFDFNNSPSLMSAADVNGRLLIQRTGAGTQGAVGAVNAMYQLICSLVNARATAISARDLAETTGGLIPLLPTFSNKSNVVSEDSVCADYVEALLYGQDDASISLAREITHLEQAGRFDFVMVGTHKHWKGITYVEVEKRNV